MESNSSSTGGISLLGLVFIVFLVLKLCHVIAWSWWWVFAPLWVPLAIGAFACIIWIIATLLK